MAASKNLPRMHMGILSFLLAASWPNPTPPPIQLEKLALNNDQHAQYQLGVNYEYGATGFEKDSSLALLWYERAHQSGNNAAYFAIRRLKIFDPKQSSNADLQRSATIESLKRLVEAFHLSPLENIQFTNYYQITLLPSTNKC